MEAIEILVQEHESILKVIEITQTILSDNDHSKVNLEHVEQIIDFIRNFADKYHHLKEEDMLFVEMVKQGMSNDVGPIAVMLADHDAGRKYIKQALEAVEKFKTGDYSAFALIQRNLLNYCELLTGHIFKENNILYPMAGRIVPETILQSMSADFDKANHTTRDNEYFDKYLKLVDELEKIYLNK